MSPRANVEQQARRRARERRVALYADRVARDRRLEEAVAEVYLRTEERAAARGAVVAAEDAMGEAVRLVLTEGISVQEVAALFELKIAEVRRLVRGPPIVDPAGAGERP